MNKTLGGYHSPVVLKAIPLEIESPVLDASVNVEPASVRTAGQKVEDIKSGVNDFYFEWQ